MPRSGYLPSVTTQPHHNTVEIRILIPSGQSSSVSPANWTLHNEPRLMTCDIKSRSNWRRRLLQTKPYRRVRTRSQMPAIRSKHTEGQVTRVPHDSPDRCFYSNHPFDPYARCYPDCYCDGAYYFVCTSLYATSTASPTAGPTYGGATKD